MTPLQGRALGSPVASRCSARREVRDRAPSPSEADAPEVHPRSTVGRNLPLAAPQSSSEVWLSLRGERGLSPHKLLLASPKVNGARRVSVSVPGRNHRQSLDPARRGVLYVAGVYFALFPGTYSVAAVRGRRHSDRLPRYIIPLGLIDALSFILLVSPGTLTRGGTPLPLFVVGFKSDGRGPLPRRISSERASRSASTRIPRR